MTTQTKLPRRPALPAEWRSKKIDQVWENWCREITSMAYIPGRMAALRDLAANTSMHDAFRARALTLLLAPYSSLLPPELCAEGFLLHEFPITKDTVRLETIKPSYLLLRYVAKLVVWADIVSYPAKTDIRIYTQRYIFHLLTLVPISDGRELWKRAFWARSSEDGYEEFILNLDIRHNWKMAADKAAQMHDRPDLTIRGLAGADVALGGLFVDALVFEGDT